MNPLDTDVLEQALASEDLVLFAYLFGSYVGGETTPLSDVDIAVYPAKQLSADDRLGIIQRLGKKTKSDGLVVTFLDRLENLFLLVNIIDRGILLADRDPDRRELFEISARHKLFDFRYQRKLHKGV